MNSSINEHQESWRSRAATFSRERLRPQWSGFEVDDLLITRVAEQARSAGLLNCFLPAWADGAGLDQPTLVLIIEELAWGEAGLALLLTDRYICYRAACLLSHAELEKKILDRLVESKNYFDPVFLFPDQDDDDNVKGNALALSQKRLRGSNAICVIRADASSYFGCGNANVDGAAKSIGFLFSGDRGKVASRSFKTLGLRSVPFNQISFEKDLADDDIILEFKDAETYSDFLRDLSAERAILFAATMLGVARASFEYALGYSRVRTTFGKPISQHQAIALKLADMATGIELSSLMLWEAASSRVNGNIDVAPAWRAWQQCQEVAMNISIQAVQILGGHGYLKQHPVEKWMRDAQCLRLLHGNRIE